MSPSLRLACGAALLLISGAALAQVAGGGRDARTRGKERGGYADPSVIIAAELAFNRLAVEKGQWAAMARIISRDAILFTPEPVFAERWIKGRINPVVPVRWQTQKVFMACDGSSAISTGVSMPSTADAGRRWFTNIWRQDKKGYRLVLSHDGPSAVAAQIRGADDLEAITARIATCPKRGTAGVPAAPLDPRSPLPMSREDAANDRSLRWRWSVGTGGARTLEAWMATPEGEVPILTNRVGPDTP